ALEEVAALAADDGELDVLALGLELLPAAVRHLLDVGVERAGEAAVRGEDHEQHRLDLPLLEERMRRLLGGDARRDRAEHVHRLDGVRTETGDVLWSSTESSRGDELHRTRDLLRALDASDPLADLLQVGHRRLRLPFTSCRPRRTRRTPSGPR